ncbi:MAG: YihA family ribosome biogenesis GTP-binding protein [Acidobacteria bacterium]|nr:YihA family ribosome biogenesis GTP-binding protein [Acidobacteriota bacterium]
MKVSNAKFIASAATVASIPRETLPEIAFMGRSNVGKSSLINSLLGVKGLARTSSTPGRTQALNFFDINGEMLFVDLPGYGYAKVSKADRQHWGKLIEKYLAQRSTLVLCILIVDARHEPSPLDLQMKSWLEHFGLSFLVVTTKIDKLSANEQRASLLRAQKVLATERLIPYSAFTRAGAKQLWDAIRTSLTLRQESGLGSH